MVDLMILPIIIAAIAVPITVVRFLMLKVDIHETFHTFIHSNDRQKIYDQICNPETHGEAQPFIKHMKVKHRNLETSSAEFIEYVPVVKFLNWNTKVVADVNFTYQPKNFVIHTTVFPRFANLIRMDSTITVYETNADNNILLKEDFVVNLPLCLTWYTRRSLIKAQTHKMLYFKQKFEQIKS
ncbi:glutamate-1-semialdehyde 2,1-aminomutase [Acrasis kona]|uniref:Glutamate-1-semialdehyde 2,1-aminomutase n=1 Tax=Acrasis kona TaxID=1008807 RepID=A0AAW2YWL4_9EUKA